MFTFITMIIIGRKHGKDLWRLLMFPKHVLHILVFRVVAEIDTSTP